MNICMVNPFFIPYMGGTEKHVYEVSKRLARKHNVTVLTSRLPKTKKEEEIDGIHIIRTRSLILKKLPHPLPPPMPVAPQMFLKIKEQAALNDVVHFHNRFTYSPMDFKVVKKEGSNLCMTLHNSRPKGIDKATDYWGGLYDDVIGKRMFSQADRIAAVSRATLEETLPKRFWRKAQIIYNGVNLEHYNPDIDASSVINKYGDYIFCNSRLVKQKGLEYLMRAMDDIQQNLVLLGRGPLEKKLKKMAPDNVIFLTEKVSEQKLVELYAGCQLFVLPSLYEPFGMVFVEAMAMEKPVIGTSVGGIPEIITEDCGIVIEPRSSSAIVRAVNTILEDPKRARKMGKAGRKRVKKYFTWDHTAEAYEKFYKYLT
ncbi:MAG: glycosyltransferase family 4 protein [Candidatus Diapherotrites archaeon]|nr:glycosyltransferase family 4 protein [Candidatus Diapherotrites archaeon]